VGAFYEFVAGLEPLTPSDLPRSSAIAPATTTAEPPALRVAWALALPDRITGLQASGDRLMALTHAGTLSEVSAEGRLLSTRPAGRDEYTRLAAEYQPAPDAAALAAARRATPRSRIAKLAARAGDRVAVACWGGTVDVLSSAGTVQAARRLPQDVTALLWFKGLLLAGDGDGNLVALAPPASN
jgi:hypothetical protein